MNATTDRSLPHAGRTVLVTGASKGLGHEYARRFAAEGADVICLDLDGGEETSEAITAAGRRALSVPCDVSDESAVRAAREAVEGFGSPDILVHNAGIYPLEPFPQITYESWRRVQAVNLDSLFLICHYFLPHMAHQGWGRIVAVSSGMYNIGAPGAVHYVASKGGVTGFIRSLAAEMGPRGVTVNAVAPGLIRTYGTDHGPHEELGMYEQLIAAQAVKRTGLPSDVSGMVSFLASDDASFITGQTILIDGGVGRT
jgi:NAD(P)-dependent dehydrogenase (short-subunit alcohol dehydrogenase family)